MSKIFLFLREVHDLVHDLEINHTKNLLKRKNFSVPKIYTGGVDILLWSSLSEAKKKGSTL